jgi:hypothetical protein
MRTILTIAMLASVTAAHAGERTWIDRGEVKRCEGVLTSNNVCIGSETYIDSSDHPPFVGRTDVFRGHDKDDTDEK